MTFRQLSADAATYRDAVEFRNGEKVRLQELEEGQSFTVLALPPTNSESSRTIASGCGAAFAYMAELKSLVGI